MDHREVQQRGSELAEDLAELERGTPEFGRKAHEFRRFLIREGIAEQLWQLRGEPVWAGDLIHKRHTKWLRQWGLARRVVYQDEDGHYEITRRGIEVIESDVHYSGLSEPERFEEDSKTLSEALDELMTGSGPSMQGYA